jgi:hypothetical protein
MSKFLTDLDVRLLDDDRIWELNSRLVYESNLLDKKIIVPEGFQTDFASVPRLPFLYTLWGDKAHREGVIHDYLYRIDSDPMVSFDLANKVFFEAMAVREKPWYIKHPMFWGVCLGGKKAYTKHYVKDKLYKEK